VLEVKLTEGEGFDSMLRRFSKKVQQAGIISEVRRRGFYEKPSIKRKRKEAAKRRKSSRSSTETFARTRSSSETFTRARSSSETLRR